MELDKREMWPTAEGQKLEHIAGPSQRWAKKTGCGQSAVVMRRGPLAEGDKDVNDL